MAEDHGRGDDPLREQPLLAVDVGQQCVQQLRALREPDLEPRPGGGIQHERHRIELPGMRAVGIAVRRAVVGEQSRDLAVDAPEFERCQLDGDRRHALPRRPQRAVGADDLVEAAAIARQGQRRLSDRGGIVA